MHRKLYIGSFKYYWLVIKTPLNIIISLHFFFFKKTTFAWANLTFWGTTSHWRGMEDLYGNWFQKQDEIAPLNSHFTFAQWLSLNYRELSLFFWKFNYGILKKPYLPSPHILVKITLRFHQDHFFVPSLDKNK